MLRIKDPKVSLPFYEKHFGMKLGVCLELTHNHGSEEDNSFKINNGNEEPYRGFGHIAFNCQDVVQISEELEKEGVKFHKRPHEGRMKTIAFAKDPDGYFIELCNRNNTNNNNNNNNKEGGGGGKEGVKEEIKEKFNLSQTMIRSEEAREFMKNLWYPCLELTHNHGTEKEESFIYHNGNDQPQGFGHIGFLTDNLDKSCDELIQQGVPFRKKPQDGKMRGIAFALDPDGYSVEIIQRGVTF
ncbi:lactoylglutathione lyase, putative [Eimeria maxima]|uniref:Lactoylglutathione lyase, putative n=1 Tax=Eimeria maxima TaxID=5804 RepID=U6LZY8_EIMMA|nr:lactoylglutathione lyase, putative [Eimeria maxima]CDJ56418.1 lactoylglutathione lyase, putative [Eimeria maxima]